MNIDTDAGVGFIPPDGGAIPDMAGDGLEGGSMTDTSSDIVQGEARDAQEEAPDPGPPDTATRDIVEDGQGEDGMDAAFDDASPGVD